MRKFLSLLLVLLLLLSLTVPALAEETEGDSDAETSESVSEGTPSDPAPIPEPDPEPDPAPSSEPEPESTPTPDPDPAPEPDPAPTPDPLPEVDPDPSPVLPEPPAEDQPPVEAPPVDLDSSTGPGGLDAPAYDVTEAPNGDIIIHSYTRTVNILGLPVSFSLDDLTMRSALVAIFGEYTPKTQTVSTYYDGQLLDTSIEYVPGVAGMDMEWIAGVIVFTVLLYCLMKLLGGVFK